MTKYLNEYQLGENFDGVLYIKNATKGLTAQQSPFLNLTLSDKTGEINAKMWNVNDNEINTFTPNTVVEINGVLSDYRGMRQLSLNSIQPVDENETIDMTELIPSAPISKNVLRDEILYKIESLQEPDIKLITKAIVNKYDADLYVYPAATRNHHAYQSGLAHHIYGMLQLGEALVNIHPEANRDLLLAGIILHDIGKIHEYESVTNPVFTLEGSLLGHISIMFAEIQETAKQLNIDSEAVLLLQHMILSHHGKGEWGSPKSPMTIEAELLHNIDMIDAKMNTLKTALDKTETGQHTERLFAMDNRSFYKHHLSN